MPRADARWVRISADPAKRVFDGRPHCGYYTQDDVREIVAYAAERFVTIVPEIEMPGHALAAIVAYPQLGVRRDTTVAGEADVALQRRHPQCRVTARLRSCRTCFVK